jgi:hypothetical protein
MSVRSAVFTRRFRPTVRVLLLAWIPLPAMAAAQDVSRVDPPPPQATSIRQTDAFQDAGAREIVRLGRIRRNTIDRSIERYGATVQERISAGLRAGALERLVLRRETAARIDWNRNGPVRIEVLGARETVPIAMKGVQVPAGLERFMPHVAFDPIDPDVFVRLDTTFLRHPLAPDAESHYRYRSGDTTTLRLPDGRNIRLLELVITPRRDDVHLLSGSFWFDADTYAVVRAVFRPARAWDLLRDDDDDDRPPGFLQPVRAELSYMTIEYGLWELRWWMPRVLAAEGVFQISRITMPLQYERRYSAYSVEGDTAAVPMPADSTETRPCRPPFRMSIQLSTGSTRTRAQRDSALRERREEAARRRAERPSANPEAVQRLEEEEECIASYDVTIPDDSVLLANEYLPPTIFEGDVALLTESELEELERIVDQLPEAPWQAGPPSFAWGLGAAGLARYNKVEALSVGAGGEWDLGRIALSAEARIGSADLEPNGELAVTRETPGGLRRLALYRRLVPANPDTRPLGIGNSLNALLWGRDDGQYYRSIGGELTLSPARSSRQWYELRLYGEHQKPAATETDFSLRHLLDDDHTFRPTIQAARADQWGADLTLRTFGGLDPDAFRWSLEAGARGETGTFRFVRPWAAARTALPFGENAITFEVSAGTASGDLPIQSAWYLGGPGTLRGYPGAVAIGESFWRARAEVSRGIPAVRITLFSDAGWAGPRAAFGTRDALASAGIGLAFLDGLVRLDVARALEPPTGWRVDFHVSRSF